MKVDTSGKLSPAVVLDTNQLVANFWMDGATFAVFLDGIPRTGHDLFVPEVVKTEARNRYELELVEKIRESASLKKRIAYLAKLKDSPNLDESGVKELGMRYAQFIDQTLKGIKGSKLPYPEITHEQLVVRATRRTRPFTEKDRGYRDTLVWLSVIDLAKQDRVVHLISNDKIFSDGKSLHPELVAELESVGLSGNSVVLHESLAEFVDTEIKPDLEPLDALSKKIESGLLQDENSREMIAAALESVSPGLPIPDSVPDFLRGAQVVAVPSVEGLRVDDIRKLPSGELFVEATVDANVEIDYAVDNSRLSSLPTEYLDGIYRNTLDFKISSGSVTERTSIVVQMLMDKGGKVIRSISPITR